MGNQPWEGKGYYEKLRLDILMMTKGPINLPF